MRHSCLFAAGLLTFAAALGAQHRVDPRNTHHRILCVVPLVGSGSWDDPIRPQYAPAQIDTTEWTGIIAYTHQISDDGRHALVEFVARDRAAFEAILADRSLKVFEKGVNPKKDIDDEFKKYKKNFDLDKFGVVMP